MLIDHEQIHRIYRAGACPVLEVTLTYPCLRGEAGEADPPHVAVSRFNDFYRGLAEAMLSWVEDTVQKEVLAAFAAEGSGAAYRFDRRQVVCHMTATSSDGQDGRNDEKNELIVTREVSFSCRRGSLEERRITATEVWRRRDLTLRPLGRSERRRGRHERMGGVEPRGRKPV